MRKFLFVLGWLILLLIIASNYINFALSTPAVIILGVLGAVFLCTAIWMGKTNK